MRYTFEKPIPAPMTDISASIEIPKRALFKPAEVCDLVKVQPYVLRTWEAEFPELGVTKTAGGPPRAPPAGGAQERPAQNPPPVARRAPPGSGGGRAGGRGP